MKKYRIAIVDDHQLVSDSLKRLIESFQDYEVISQLSNGIHLIEFLKQLSELPHIVLLDINMPQMGGKKTMEFLHSNYPNMKVLVLSMDDDDETILHMLRHGAKGYILKDINPKEFKNALDSVIHKGFYHSDLVNSTLLNEVLHPPKDNNDFSERELQFIELICTEKTYKEIAADMFLSPKTIDGYRESLFKKLGVKNRVGLVLYAIKNGIVKI